MVRRVVAAAAAALDDVAVDGCAWRSALWEQMEVADGGAEDVVGAADDDVAADGLS